VCPFPPPPNLLPGGTTETPHYCAAATPTLATDRYVIHN